jgi:hypothetical protein
MESITSPKIVEIHDDNIADDETTDEQLAQFIQDTENASIADLYIKHLSGQPKSIGRDFTSADDLPPNRVIDNVGSGISVSHYDYYNSGSFHPSTSGYSKYPTYDDIGKARKKKSHRSRVTTTDDMQNSIDLIGDQVESILDCVKSTDQIINDIHERQLGVGDSIEELQEHARGTTMRTVELNSRMTELEKNQKAIIRDHAKITESLSQIAKVLQVMHLNVKCIRWGEDEESN